MESEPEVVFTIVIGGDTWEFRYPFGVPFPDVGEVIHLEEERVLWRASNASSVNEMAGP